MKRFKIIEKLFGIKYIVNHNSKEIHKIKNITKVCRTYLMTKANYISKKKAEKLLNSGYNGCCFCYPEKDDG